MTLLYSKEHKACFNYEKSNNPIVAKYDFDKDYTWDFTTDTNKLVFVLKGQFSFSYGEYKNKSIVAEQMIIIPVGNSIQARINEDATIIVISLLNAKNLCECFSLDLLLKEESENAVNNVVPLLEAHSKIVAFFKQFDVYLSDKLLCKYFLKLKTEELLYLLRAYTTKEDLLDFFSPILSNDMTFSDFVMNNHCKVKTVNELAALANYSLSGFQKRFQKVFDMSVYRWMKEEKLKLIFHDINNSTAAFKQISEKFGFSSPSHFNDFCKSNFGYTPGILRKNKINLRIIKE